VQQMKPKGVRATHPEYDEHLPIWQTVADCEKGQRAIHLAGVKYLPKLAVETPDGYAARLSRSAFFNAFWRTVSGLTGMAFRVDPIATVPDAILPLLEDINLAGVSADAMAKAIVEHVTEYGRVGLLVDHPPMPENVSAISQAAAEAGGMRPVVQFYPAMSVINWRYGRVANAWKLVLVVLKEAHAEPISEFEDATESRYRVLDLANGAYRSRVFRIDKRGNDEQVGADVYPLMRGKPMAEIPFTFIGENGMGAQSCDDPPLGDLIDANLAHYTLWADLRHALHFAGLPTLFLSGVTSDKPIYAGGDAAITSEHPDAKGSYIELQGDSLAALEKAIASQEQRMAMLGARMVADETKQAETLGATQIKRAGENSVMAAIVRGVSDAMEWALKIVCDWQGVDGKDVSYEISRRFLPAAMGPQELTALMAAWQGGGLSEAELFANLQEGEIIDSAKTLEEHQEEIGAMALPSPAAVAA